MTTILRAILALAAFLIAKAGIVLYRKRHPRSGECPACARMEVL